MGYVPKCQTEEMAQVLSVEFEWFYRQREIAAVQKSLVGFRSTGAWMAKAL